MYRNKPFKMHKIFEEIYHTKDYDGIKTYNIFQQIANPFNKVMLNEYIYFKYKFKYGYERNENRHDLNNEEHTVLFINNHNIKIKSENNYSIFFNDLNAYSDSLFVCDFENKDYFWLSKLYNESENSKVLQTIK